MSVERFAPSRALAPFIESYVLVESSGSNANRILPATSLAMAFRLRGTTFSGDETGSRRALPSSAISGLTRSSRLVAHSEGTAILVTLFRETGAAAFIEHPLHELFEQHVALDSVIGRSDVDRVEDALADATDSRRRIAVLERFLLSILRPPAADTLIQAARRKIRLAQGNVRVKELAVSLNTSMDVLEKRFRSAVGTSPKRYSAIVRVQHAIERFSTGGTLTDTAYASGYYDQSHFIREFRAFSGQSPREFFAQHASRPHR